MAGVRSVKGGMAFVSFKNFCARPPRSHKRIAALGCGKLRFVCSILPNVSATFAHSGLAEDSAEVVLIELIQHLVNLFKGVS